MYGYPQSPRGYSSNNYRYSQPQVREYESFFNPIPLDFMIGQLDKAQQKYDTGYASAMEAKDAFGGVKVDNEDIATKNQIVSQFVDNTDKMVKDQFGGDWGRAAKSVARSVSEVRNNEFWNASANAQAERKRVQELADKYGAKAMIFGDDMRGKSTIDENGRVRKFAPAEVVEQGKWGDTVRRIFSSLQPEKYQAYGLTKDDMEGFVRTGTVSEITRAKLEKLSNDPLVQQVFQQEHPEFVRGFNEFDEKGRANFGIQGENLSDATRRTILGNIAPAAFKQSAVDYMNDQVGIANAKKEIKGSIWGGMQEDIVQPTGYTTGTEGMKISQRIFDDTTGELIFGKGKDDRFAKTGYSYVKAGAIQEKIQDLRKNNPKAFEGKSDIEVYSAYLKDGDQYKQSINKVIPLLDDDISLNIGKTASGSIQNTTFTLRGGEEVTGNYIGKNGITDKTNVPVAAFKNLLVDKNIAKGYDITEGSFYMEVPVFKKEPSMNSDGSVNWSKAGFPENTVKVYFNPDAESKGSHLLLKSLDRYIKDKSFDSTILEDRGIVVDKNALEKAKKDGEDINYVPLFTLVANQEEGPRKYSLEEIRRIVFDRQTKNLESNYYKR